MTEMQGHADLSHEQDDSIVDENQNLINAEQQFQQIVSAVGLDHDSDCDSAFESDFEED